MDIEIKYPELNFHLPNELIAKFALKDRASSKLMLINRNSKKIEILDSFNEIKQILNSNDSLVFNSTKVSKRRVYLFNDKGKEFEVLFLERKENNWNCLIKNQRKLTLNDRLYTKDNKYLFIYSDLLNFTNIESKEELNEEFFDKYGSIPIPPYFKRKANSDDETSYQTIFAEQAGSVAAPTAGLHFTNELKKEIQEKGVNFLDVELRIGYGTFGKLVEKNFSEKKLHSEYYKIKNEVAAKLNSISNGRVLAIGTTSLRALESSYDRENLIYRAYEGNTELFITPEDRIYSIQGLITNFHLPGSSLILLVSAFAGSELISKAYKIAIQEKFRFFSYGDAMLII